MGNKQSSMDEVLRYNVTSLSKTGVHQAATLGSPQESQVYNGFAPTCLVLVDVALKTWEQLHVGD
jgi:hypothetical protein